MLIVSAEAVEIVLLVSSSSISRNKHVFFTALLRARSNRGVEVMCHKQLGDIILNYFLIATKTAKFTRCPSNGAISYWFLKEILQTNGPKHSFVNEGRISA